MMIKTSMKHIFIVNPVAGKHDGTEEIAKMAESYFPFTDFSQSHLIIVTQAAGHATEIARSFGKSGEEICFYACGGDGTLNEVLNGMYLYKNCTLTQIPIGSGNDFIRCFGENARDLFLSLPELAKGQEVPVDLLAVGGKVAVNIVSAGLDSAIAKNVAKFKKWPLIGGHAAYNLSLAYCFFTSIKNRYAFEVDGKAAGSGEYVFAVAANGRFYGGGFQAAPEANWQDGLIDFITIDTVSRLKIPPLVKIFKNGEHLKKLPIARLARCKNVKILADQELCLNVDGEIMYLKDPEISILPGALRLILPKSLAPACEKEKAAAL